MPWTWQVVAVAAAVAIADVAIAVKIPASKRSQAAIARVKPGLQAQTARLGLRWGSPIHVRIFKRSSKLELWLKSGDRYRLFKTYRICYFSGELGPKLQIGDLQSPEGFYVVRPRQLNPASTFHLSFNIGFPNRYDRQHGRRGQYLMVHGNCVSLGCYAMTDKAIEEIYTLAVAAFKNGQPFFRVHIFPFRMSAKNMHRYRHSRWISFWRNLKQGYDYFERRQRPPAVRVFGRRYHFR